MLKNRLGLLLAAGAAYGYYRYSKMTPQQKTDLRTRGKGFLDKQVGGLKDMFGKFTKPRASNSTGY